MIDWAAFSWVPAAIRTLKDTLSFVAELRIHRRPQRAPVSFVVHRALYNEATQPDGSVASQIMVDCWVTNSAIAVLMIVKAECYVRRHGTVQGAALTVVKPQSSLDERYGFHFSRPLGKPHRSTMILTDQFAKEYRIKVGLHHGSPLDPH